jgi:hypothetical protein
MKKIAVILFCITLITSAAFLACNRGQGVSTNNEGIIKASAPVSQDSLIHPLMQNVNAGISFNHYKSKPTVSHRVKL